MEGAAAEMDGASASPFTPPGVSLPSRRMTIVGTPSSPVTRKRLRAVVGESVESDVVVASGESDEGVESLSGPSAAAKAAPARESSSELRLNSCQKHGRG